MFELFLLDMPAAVSMYIYIFIIIIYVYVYMLYDAPHHCLKPYVPTNIYL
jgi:hypothetical protein